MYVSSHFSPCSFTSTPPCTIPCLKVALMWKGSVYQASQYPCTWHHNCGSNFHQFPWEKKSSPLFPRPSQPPNPNPQPVDWEGPHRIGRGSQPLGVADVPSSWIRVVLLKRMRGKFLTIKNDQKKISNRNSPFQMGNSTMEKSTKKKSKVEPNGVVFHGHLSNRNSVGTSPRSPIRASNLENPKTSVPQEVPTLSSAPCPGGIHLQSMSQQKSSSEYENRHNGWNITPQPCWLISPHHLSSPGGQAIRCLGPQTLWMSVAF